MNEPDTEPHWDASQNSQWCWWRIGERPAHRGRQGRGGDTLCGTSNVLGGRYVAPSTFEGMRDGQWCSACLGLYKLKDHGSDLVKAERELAELQVASRALAEELRRAGANMATYCTTDTCDVCGRRVATRVIHSGDADSPSTLTCDTCGDLGDELPLGALLSAVETLLLEAT